MVRGTDSIYTFSFGLLCLSSFLFSASFNMLIPELPAYLSSLGGAEYKGLIIGLFTLTAGISRPFSGKLTDTVGRVPVMAVGSVVCFVCGFLYPVLSSISGFLLLRLLHGFSTGFKPTATAAYVADIIPLNRWGEAMGVHSLCFSTGMAIGPAIGSAITSSYSINILFYCSSLFALLSIVILTNLRETLQNKHQFSLSHLKIGRHEIVEKQALPAAVVTFMSYFGYGTIVTLIPDWSNHVGMQNKGLFFMTFTVASLLIRLVAGKASDRYGRVKMLKLSIVVLIVALFLIGFSETPFQLLAASVVYGVGSGILSPAVSAWTVDLSHAERRGKATATMYIALEAGIGLGALVAGWMFQDVMDMVPKIFYLSAAAALGGLVYLLCIYKPVKPSVA